MKIGDLVQDWALGRSGILIGGPFTEPDGSDQMRSITWEWEVLYDNGELMGADTNDLKVPEETIEHEIEYMAMALAE